ncbi:MAG: phosphatase PAP2 family protein [Chloroflexi bacterium]|nr:phosphatase PAP2 family protein [Chloroflexota bacterium]
MALDIRPHIGARIHLLQPPRFPLPNGRYSRFFFEVAVLFTGYFSYHLVRGVVHGRADEALENAWRLVRVEQGLGIFWEAQLQSMILGHTFLINLFNWAYIWGHIPVVGFLALWIYFFRREHFARYRNAFLISGAIGLIFFVTLPTAPPRFLAEAGFVDTVTEHTNAYRVLQPPAFVNQYAAMPSLHFGWNLLVAYAVFETTRSRLARAFSLVMPAVMMASIVFTANHYILDGVTGGFVAMVSLWLAMLLHERFRGTRISCVLV